MLIQDTIPLFLSSTEFSSKSKDAYPSSHEPYVFAVWHIYFLCLLKPLFGKRFLFLGSSVKYDYIAVD